MPTPDHHEQQEEADQDVDERSAGRRAPPAPAGTDPVDAIATATEEQQSAARPSSARRRARCLVPPTATLHRLVRRPPLAECWPRPSVMGVVNVTPDSFSDGGDNLDPAIAVATARRLLAEGAALVDIGGESTRPGAEAVSARRGAAAGGAGARAARGRPGLDRHLEGRGRAPGARARARCSSTTSPRCAAIPALAGVVADAGAYVCLMHMQGEPRTMQVEPRYDDVVGEVAGFLEERLAAAVAAGIPRGARLPRPGHRLRQDARPEPRADPWPRADLPDRPAGARRALAQEHAGAGARRPERRASARDRGVGRRRRGGVRPRRGAVPRPRRRAARRGARGCGGGRAGERRR